MPTKYQPTGRPPGRPRKPEVERQGIRDVTVVLKDTMTDRAHLPMNAYCPDCFPEGFPVDAKAMGCVHGTWVKRL